MEEELGINTRPISTAERVLMVRRDARITAESKLGIARGKLGAAIRLGETARVAELETEILRREKELGRLYRYEADAREALDRSFPRGNKSDSKSSSV